MPNDPGTGPASPPTESPLNPGLDPSAPIVEVSVGDAASGLADDGLESRAGGAAGVEETVLAQSRSATASGSYAGYVVGIGASAGGLRPLQEFFSNLSGDTGASFVVVQHLSPDFKSLMPELIGRQTTMRVMRVEHGLEPEPNTVYLNTPRTAVELRNGAFHLTPFEHDLDAGPHFPIDRFLRSLADDAGIHSIAMILSGTGSDGSRGLRDIDEVGGIVLVQDPGTCQFDGMPQSAISTGFANVVAGPVKLAEIVDSVVRRAGERVDEDTTTTERPLPDSGDGVEQIIKILERSESIDFSHYKRSTIRRRIERRRLLSGRQTLSAYVSLLEESAQERAALRGDLLITVTSFFRDAPAWTVLQSEAIPRLIKDCPAGRPIRIWTAACATGEEAYSMAIAVTECMERLGIQRDVKIFATDIDERSLERASTGAFSRAIVGDVSEPRLRRFFQWRNEQFFVSREIREKIIFAPHDLTRDAPFTRLDLVSCRNVLIYMQSELQQHVIRMLHFSLRVGGALFLGAADVVGAAGPEFDAIDARWKILSKRRDVRLSSQFGPLSVRSTDPKRRSDAPHGLGTGVRRDSMLGAAIGRVLERQSGLMLLVDGGGALLQSYGNTEDYMQIPRGYATNEAAKLMPSSLQLPLHTSLHRARTGGGPAVYRGMRVEVGGVARVVDMSVERLDIPSESSETFLVMIEESERSAIHDGDAVDLDAQVQERIHALESELDHTRENLQATIEELESTNEEQQASNEELLASNEELQSTNEELHSLNEELFTVNAEYQAKIVELTELHHDMDNLLMSTNIGTIFLDRELRVRKFTPAATEAFNLVDVDVGRPIEHLSHNLEYPSVFEDLRVVLESGRPCERRTVTRHGHPLLVRINPYRTEQSRHDGVVLTFIDLDEPMEAARRASAEAEAADGGDSPATDDPG